MAKDAFKYFRVEARELMEGLTKGVLDLERGTGAVDVVPRLLRLAHTLKGAARVVRQSEIADHAHRIEGYLAGHRDSGAPVSRETQAELLKAIDAIAGLVGGLEPEGAATPVPARAEERLESVRVEMPELDSLLRDATEAGVQLGAVRRELLDIDRLRGLSRSVQEQLSARQTERARALAGDLNAGLDRLERAVASHLERVEGDLTEARAAVSRLRLVPARTIFGVLERAVHDAAQELGRKAVFETNGGDVRVDASVLTGLRDALHHIVRNAVAHGIEPEGARSAAGKPPAGRVRLTVERIGNRVVFRCSDDGRGIDVEAVRRIAIARGTNAAQLGREEILRLILNAGLSTRAEVTELAGRGIGLDVAREAVARLKGEIAVSSQDGKGATIELRVPVSLASFAALLLSSGETTASIPLDAVRGTLFLKTADLSRIGNGDAASWEGKVVPFITLPGALRREARDRARQGWQTVIVEAGDGLAAVGVDRIVGTSQVIMRSVPAVVGVESSVAGVSLDTDGDPQLVLDPAGLVQAAKRGSIVAPEERKTPRLPLLVIDDSLTTRMLEKSILESAGYTVELATSAEEGLEKAHVGRYGVFIVDVEMPGMDGFSFIAQTRTDPTLRETPAILVTSRNEPADRRRGEEVGARAYIVKSEFDQGRLLQTIRSLLGQSR